MLEFNLDEHKYKHVHFIGIGGISMSALAEIAHNYGYTVTGTDSRLSDTTKKLENLGINIFYNHAPENIEGADLIVYTDAISLDNKELKQAILKKIDVMDRASFLGAIMNNYNFTIAISGTHGKTSTTSMISEIIENEDFDPTIMLGGQLDSIHGNVKIGKRNLLLTEACEYKGNILKYNPKMAVILNIDEDHLDYFDNINHIIETFKDYAKKLRADDYLILNYDDVNTRELIAATDAKVITFGMNSICDFTAKNIHFNRDGFPCYDIYRKHKKLCTINLSVMGTHNVYNSLAAFISCFLYGVDIDTIVNRLSSYKGVHRRLETKGIIKEITVLDDYAHHPTEIKATLQAVRNRFASEVYCIFQPHTFTRTKLLLNSFSESFDEADKIIITDIYAAREKDYGDIHSKTLVDAVRLRGKNAMYIKTFEEVESYLEKNVKPGDCVLTMGAGDVYKIGEMYLEKLKK
ncbi:MAG: UDP-N-acetylmuramate--L-alanine ligase [Tissierellia bacterium]|nr:UDP-N-acetylmuramate--L-alanine ligase [Tissierellia bacterium]